jgi:hypothetical protein
MKNNMFCPFPQGFLWGCDVDMSRITRFDWRAYAATNYSSMASIKELGDAVIGCARRPFTTIKDQFGFAERETELFFFGTLDSKICGGTWSRKELEIV